ncbi:MAG: transposase [Methylocella sp.]
MAAVLDAGAGIVVRCGWRNARWLDADGEPADLAAEFRKAAARGLIDRPIWVARKGGTALALRLVAVGKPGQAAETARRRARQAPKKGGHQISQGTRAAAEWAILATSLAPEIFSTADVLDLYRLRRRIERGFKRLKSLIGLNRPPGIDERSPATIQSKAQPPFPRASPTTKLPKNDPLILAPMGSWPGGRAGMARPARMLHQSALRPGLLPALDEPDRTVMGSDAQTRHAQQMLRVIRAVQNGHAMLAFLTREAPKNWPSLRCVRQR